MITKLAHLTTMTLLAVATFATAACNVYDPELPDQPFRCGAEDPQCPDGFTCEQQGAINVCVADNGGGGPDGGGGNLQCNDDSMVEPNDTLPQATASRVDERPTKTITLTQMAICPDTDRDTFSMIIGSTNIDVTVTVELEDESVPLNLAILNANGNSVTTGTKAGNLVTAHLANAPVETIFAQVTAASGNRNNYKITLTLE